MKEFQFFVISFFEADFDTIEKRLIKIFENKDNYKIFINEDCKISDVYHGLSPQKGGFLPMKALIYVPIANESICALYTNSSDGWETLVYRISKELSVKCWIFYISSADNEFPKNGFELIKDGNTIRKVTSFRDWNKWEFIENGIPLSMEDDSLFKKKNKKDRVNLNSVVQVSRAYNMNFYGDSLFFTTNTKCIHIEEIR